MGVVVSIDRHGAPPTDSAIDRERSVASIAMTRPEHLRRILGAIDLRDLRDPATAEILRAADRLVEDAEPVTLLSLADDLERHGRLALVGGRAGLAEIADYEATDAQIDWLLGRIRRDARERRLRDAHARLAADPADAEARRDLAAAEAEGRERRGTDLDALAFRGPRLLALLDRPPAQPVYAGVPTPGHLTLWVAPPMTGKTSLAAWVGAAEAGGVAPWEGAPAPQAPGRVLYLSLDEAPEQLARRLRGLGHQHPAGPLSGYADRLHVVGPDVETDPAALDALHLDEAGLAILDRWLDKAAEVGEPYTTVYVDAYADMLPPGETENSNEEATRIGGALERLAIRSGVAIVLLHHAGKPRADASAEELPDVRYMGRGASALAAKARVVSVIESVSGMPHLRRIRTVTNLGRPPRPLTLRVAAPEAEPGELIMWRAHDPLSEHDPRSLLADGPASTRDLARRLAGMDSDDRAEPPGEMRRLATQLRERWREAGLVTVERGARGAQIIRLRGVHDGE